ncbi:hypothetical protein [Bacillus benzoevorans]|uniref:Uncharacterized protein n=1 Tax=Bacillus benzoevorans TaxID=1456 RepID=A0A7X0HVK3_9BACI|nr:hypothetical protein [Bacillus benzoevorans]MBB6447697.1 hypothetical protein [Bacillus benzoevorans]
MSSLNFIGIYLAALHLPVCGDVFLWILFLETAVYKQVGSSVTVGLEHVLIL